MFMKRILCLFVSLLWGAASLLSAQDEKGGVPEDVFYLMPEMANGSVQFRGQAPATGKFNICAIDNTVRYKDRDGTELAVDITEDMTRVVIGGITFIPHNGMFLRLHPISDDVSVAVQRSVLLMTDSKTSGYGMESQTTAVSNVMGISSDTRYYQFKDSKDIPYRMSETAFLCKGESVMTLNKRNLQKCFPQSKDAIDAWFSQNKKLDASKVETVMELCREWAGK